MDVYGNANVMLDLISQRQRALGSNVANVDTPGYVRRDVDFSQYLGSMNSPLETQLSAKLGPAAIIDDREKTEIDIAEEFSEIQRNSILYNVATRRMTNIITQMKSVINVGR
jgi:flagellar basal body rod protein FlgB